MIPHGRSIWSGDEWCDKQAGCPSVYDKWRELFREELDTKQAVQCQDDGDAVTYLMPNGYVVCIACDGNTICEPAAKADDRYETDGNYKEYLTNE